MNLFACVCGGFVEVLMALLLASAISQTIARQVNKWRSRGKS